MSQHLHTGRRASRLLVRERRRGFTDPSLPPFLPVPPTDSGLGHVGRPTASCRSAIPTPLLGLRWLGGAAPQGGGGVTLSCVPLCSLSLPHPAEKARPRREQLCDGHREIPSHSRLTRYASDMLLSATCPARVMFFHRSRRG